MRCKHCYLYEDETYKSEIENELDFDNRITIMDDFISFCRQLKIRPAISFTGGDPFLREDFFELLDEAKKRNILINILGNSFLLDEKTVLVKLELTVVKNNKNAIALYKKYGFVIEGLRKKSMIKDNNFYDDYYIAKFL